MRFRYTPLAVVNSLLLLCTRTMAYNRLQSKQMLERTAGLLYKRFPLRYTFQKELASIWHAAISSTI
jgi:hypothetical protein